MKRYILWTAFFVLAAFGLAEAQGTQTGTISGSAKSPDGLAFPGVSVTVKSPALQGVRSATTDQNGNYIFKALPPGRYLVTFQVAGMQTLEQTAELELGRGISVNGTLQVGGITETVTVTETLPGIVETASGGANYKASEIDDAADRPHGRRDRRAHPGPDRQHAERRPGHDLRRLRLRQRVPDRRRRRQRQRLRYRQQPVHRGRDRGAGGDHLRDLGRVRPFRRRDHQHHHQARRQHVPGQLPFELHELRLADGDAVREGDGTSRTTPSSTRSSRRPSVARSSRTGSGSSWPAARRRPSTAGAYPDLGSPITTRERQQAPDRQADRDDGQEPHADRHLHLQQLRAGSAPRSAPRRARARAASTRARSTRASCPTA